MTKDVLSEFENLEKRSLSKVIVSVLYTFSILISFGLNYKSYTTVSGQLIISSPHILLSLLVFHIVPIIISILFIAKKKVGWILLTFTVIVFISVLAKLFFESIGTNFTVITRGGYFLLNFLIILFFLFRSSLINTFKITRKNLIYTLSISLFASILLVLLIR